MAGVCLAGLAWWGWPAARPTAGKNVNWTYVEPFGIRLPLRYTQHGIDVSRHNGRINWDRVADTRVNGEPLAFAYIKATEGATFPDPQFQRNWREAKRVGLRRGAYHFYHPTRDAQRQADHFIRRVTLQSGDLAPVLDFEVINGVAQQKVIDGLRIWLTAVEAHYGIRPIIYTNAHLYERYVKNHLPDYPLWIADYSNPNVARYNANRLFIWQHNKGGRLPGIRGSVDFNVFVTAPERLSAIIR